MAVMLPTEIMHELDNSEWAMQLNWPAGTQYADALQGVARLQWDENPDNLCNMTPEDLNEPALFSMGEDVGPHPYLDMMNGFRKIHGDLLNGRQCAVPGFPKDQTEGGSWIADINHPHLGMQGAFSNYQAQLFKERDILCWTANVSCMKIGNFTKGHNHVAPVGIGACTGGRKMMFLLPPHLSTKSGKFKMKMKEADQHKSFAAMLKAVEEYEVKAHCCVVWPSDFLYIPAGWWHWTLTLPPHPRSLLIDWPLKSEEFCIALSTYVMAGACDTLWIEQVLADMLKVYECMGAKQKRETLHHLSVECSKPFAGMSILQHLVDTAPATKIDDINPLARELMKYYAQIKITHNNLHAAAQKRENDELYAMSMNLSAEDLDPNETREQSMKRFKKLALANPLHRTKLQEGVFRAPLNFDEYVESDAESPVLKVKVKFDATAAVDDEAKWLEKGLGAVNIAQRLMRDIKRINQCSDWCHYDSLEAFMRDADMQKLSVISNESDITQPWRISLPYTLFQDDAPELAHDLAMLNSLTGMMPHIDLECTFPPDFPSSAPFIRVISPRFVNLTGHVTQGGSICTEILSNGGSAQAWKPSITMESIIIILKNLFVDGKGRLWLDPGCEEPYDPTEAREAHKRALRTHGWV